MKVVVTDCDFSDLSIERAVLGLDVEVELLQSRDPDTIVSAALDAQGLLVQYAPIGVEVLRRLPSLQAIVRYGIGLDNIDLKVARRHAVAVRNVPDYCLDEVAEHTLAMTLQVARRLTAFRESASRWSIGGVPVPRAARSQTVGVAGMGQVGRRVAALAAAIGFQVAYHDPYASDLPTAWQREETLAELADRSDHLSVHVPLTEDTRDLVGADVIRRLGPGGHLINTSRGALIDEHALLGALEAGDLGWASLDVLRSEPPSGVSAQLLRHPHCFVTPHVAYLSEDSLVALPRRAAEIMRGLLVSTV